MDWSIHILYPLSRWLHIVSMTLIVGGTMFYELVVPIAIEDLKSEQQLYVFARARWVYRWVVFTSALLLILTGLVSVHRMWTSYMGQYHQSVYFMLVHVSMGLAAVMIAVLLTVSRTPPAHPVRWMRINLVIMLVAIFAANTTRHVRLVLRDHIDAENSQMKEHLDALESLKTKEESEIVDLHKQIHDLQAATGPATRAAP